MRLLLSPEEIRETGRRVSPPRQVLIDALAETASPQRIHELAERTHTSRAIFRAMAKDGWIVIEQRKEGGEPSEPAPPLDEPNLTLTDEQQTALDHVNVGIDSGGFLVTLVHGVSGSGKTEIYIRAIRRVVAQGKQAVLLVPEIALTTQVVDRLASRLADVAVNHSGLTGAQRSVLWRQIAAGQKKVVIGTRSAVFAPCPALGIICVDEEQETSYKNLQAPRFHVRDVAIMRAHQLGIPVVLGSATPAVETWYHSEHRKEYTRVSLRHRVKDLPMPRVDVIDMREEFRDLKRGVVLSRTTDRLMADTLRRGEQAIILMNRRGYARWLFCPSCKSPVECPNCRVAVVAHAATGDARCHYCRHRLAIPKVCPIVTCGAVLVEGGIGTQRVEEVLAKRFPGARIERMDSDTMRHRRHYERVIGDFTAGKIDVLVGTQMLAKGLDFPHVSFVGVLGADAGAVATDFRAHERLFQLITQVAGRAGRADATGRVVVQTMAPEAYALQYAMRHDFEGFAAHELGLRQQLGLPPFSRLARVLVNHEREDAVREAAEILYGRVTKAIADIELKHADALGPSPCALLRLRGRYRYDLILRTHTAADMRQLLVHMTAERAWRTKAKSLVIDVDPVAFG